jgi:hypothetical protein
MAHHQIHPHLSTFTHKISREPFDDFLIDTPGDADFVLIGSAKGAFHPYARSYLPEPCIDAIPPADLVPREHNRKWYRQTSSKCSPPL